MDKYRTHYDVIVAGAGPAGIAAAVSAARQGASVALVERYGIVGGMMTSGYVNPVLGRTERGTIYEEIMSLLDASCLSTRNGKEMSINTEQAKYLLLRFICDAGVHMFLQTPVIDTIKRRNTVEGLRIGTQSGIKDLFADIVVDATGDGFVSSQAGAEYKIGRDSDGHCQPVSHEFTIVDVDKDSAFTCWGGSDPVLLPSGQKYADFCKQANEQGILPKNVSIVRIHRTNCPGERSINATQANGYDTLSPEGVVDAELELRSQIDKIIDFLRAYVPGFEKCRLKATGSSLGVRETRRIIGDYILNDTDVETGTRKADVVVHKAWFLIDIHNPVGGGQAEGHSQPAIPYDIPYRALLPKGIENLITCGRCISGTHRAHASYRVMGVCLATGQAAGIAAALSSKYNVNARDLDITRLQKALMDTGAVLFDENL